MLRKLLIIALVVMFVSIAASAQEGVTYLEGQIAVIHRDPAPGSGGEYQVVTSIIDDNGQKTQLDLPVAMEVHDLGRVRVHGAFMPAPQSGNPIFSVSAVERLHSPMESPNFIGTLQYLTVLCRFSDSVGDPPHPVSYYDGLMGNTNPGVQHFWNELSLGQLNVVSTNIGQWFTMSNPMSAYDMTGSDWSAKHDQMAQDCIDAADPSFDFSPYDGLTMIFDRSYAGFALGGQGSFTIEGATKFIRITWNPPFSFNNVTTLAHEVGHTLGLPHSAGIPGDPNGRYPYDSYWDVMSGGGDNNKVVDGTYGDVGPNTIAYHMDRLNWIDTRRVTVATGTAQTVTLERMNQPVSTTNPLMAKIPINSSSTNFYTVEARFVDSGYDAAIPGTGVIINIVDTSGSRAEPARIVDGDGNTDVNDAGAMWLPGETFTDGANGISIQVNSQPTSSSFEVCIVNGGGVCASATPTANDDNYSTLTDQQLTVSAADGVLKNDTGSNLTAILETNVSNGTLNFNSDGSFDYTPFTNFQGTDTFTYKANDGSQDTNTATASIFVGDIIPQAAPQQLDLTGTLNGVPTKPTFQWQHVTQGGQTSVPGAYYRLYLAQGNTLVFDDWFDATQICSGIVCTVPYPETTPGVLGNTMPSWGLVSGEHTFYVQSYIDANTPLEWSAARTFTVNPAAPALASGFSVDNSTSPAKFEWTDDANALYYYLYIGDGVNEPLFFNWVEKTNTICDGMTCTFTTPTPPSNGTYQFYIQSWGPGGFPSGGILNLGWEGAPVIVGPGLATNLSTSLAGSTPTFSFTAAPDATSYRIWVGTVNGTDVNEAHFQTYTSADLGCTLPGSTCMLTLNSPALSPDTYNWYVQGIGATGDSAAGDLSGWAVGDQFTVN